MRVESIEHLKQLCTEGKHEYYIMLNYGLRSSKYIAYDPTAESFDITNKIDDTEQRLMDFELNDERETNIGKAIQKGQFFTCE